MNQIENLYLEYIESREYFESTSSDESTEAALEAVRELLGRVPDEVMRLATEYEELGFCNGFRYAMRIAAACGLPHAMEVSV